MGHRDRQLDRRQPERQIFTRTNDTAIFGYIASDSTITVAPGGVNPAGVQISNPANKYTFTGGPINGSRRA